MAQATKQGLLYVFDRVTGQPVWPIEEKPVPQTDVPGEKTSPTQPFPTKPPAYSRNGVIESDLIDFTPELKAAGLEASKRFRLGPAFLPPVVSKAEGPIGALTSGTLSGGVNWPGSAYDPEMHAFFTHACNSCIAPLGLVAPPKEFSDLDYVMGTAGATFRPITGGGEGEAADAPRPRASGDATSATDASPAAGWRTRLRPAGGGGGFGATVQGLSIVKPPLRTDRRHQSRQGRADVVDAARRHAGRGAQSSGAEGREHPEDRPAGQRRRGRDQDARRRRRSQRDDDAGASARGDAARLRQDTPARRSARSGCRRRRAARR